MSFIREKHRFSPSIKKDIAQLRDLDNWHCIVALIYDYGIIGFSFWLFMLSHWLYPISLILIGSRQRALATILHESAHQCIAKSKRFNYFIGSYLSGFLIFQEYYSYCDSHVKKHHAYLGDENVDPDLVYHKEQKLYEPHDRISFFIDIILKPLVFLKSTSYLKYLIKNRLIQNKLYKKRALVMLSCWFVIFCLSYNFHLLTMLILLWIVPLATTANIVGWFNELSEHFPLVSVYKKDLYMTRNRFSHWLEHFIFNMHNENYHLIHHLYPTIPFWNLPKAHIILCKDNEYSRLNQDMGGIFVSKNNNSSLVKRLLTSFPRVKESIKLYESR